MEADISTWQKTGHFYFALTHGDRFCRCKVRVSGLCKVEMSAFLRAGGPDGRGADRIGATRARSAEGIARSGARAFETAGSRGAVGAQRAADSALAAAS